MLWNKKKSYLRKFRILFIGVYLFFFPKWTFSNVVHSKGISFCVWWKNRVAILLNIDLNICFDARYFLLKWHLQLSIHFSLLKFALLWQPHLQITCNIHKLMLCWRFHFEWAIKLFLNVLTSYFKRLSEHGVKIYSLTQ